jgi:hypothetical protein
MSTATDWRQFDDQTFSRWIDRMPAETYKQYLKTDSDWVKRVNGHPWKEQRSIHDVMPKKVGGELGQMVAEMDYEDERPEREANEAIQAQVDAHFADLRVKLDKALRIKSGLPDEVWTWLNINPKELHFLSSAGSASLSKSDTAVIKSAYEEFCAKVKRTFDEKERQTLMVMLQDCAGLAQCLDPRVESSWSAAYTLCKKAKLISDPKPTPTAPQRKIELPRGLTESAKKQAYFNKTVVTWRGKELTQSDVDALGSEDYKKLVGQTGFDGGKIVKSFSQLLKMPGSRQ